MFGLGVVFDYVIDLIDFFSINRGECSLILMTSDVLMFCFDA